MFNFKKAQEAGAVGVFIILLALFIVLFILLLPPTEREKLLNQTTTNRTDTDLNGDNLEEVLLLESPGLIEPTPANTKIHNLGSINLFLKIEPEIKTLANSLYVSRTLFSNQFQELTFNIEDLENIKDSLLTFTVKEPKGRLLISLNNNPLFNQQIKETTIKTVILPVNALQKNNRLKIEANLNIFTKNKFILEDVKLKEEFERINSREEKTFVISETEKENLQDSMLTYELFCNSLTGTTLLKIYLNNEVISSEIIACTSGERTLEIEAKDINEGTNTLLFLIESGDFLFNEVKIVNKLDRDIGPLFEFDIESDDFERIRTNEKDVILELDFIDDDETKKASIFINSERIHFDTKEDKFERDISDLVEKGQNLLRISPSNEFEIILLKVTLVE